MICHWVSYDFSMTEMWEVPRRFHSIWLPAAIWADHWRSSRRSLRPWLASRHKQPRTWHPITGNHHYGKKQGQSIESKQNATPKTCLRSVNLLLLPFSAATWLLTATKRLGSLSYWLPDESRIDQVNYIERISSRKNIRIPLLEK